MEILTTLMLSPLVVVPAYGKMDVRFGRPITSRIHTDWRRQMRNVEKTPLAKAAQTNG